METRSEKKFIKNIHAAYFGRLYRRMRCQYANSNYCLTRALWLQNILHYFVMYFYINFHRDTIKLIFFFEH